MKIKGILLATFSLLGISGAFAQVEYDDMYFNKEDRAKLEAQRSTAVAQNDLDKHNKLDEEISDINPTDSYSARNVNPEYTSRAHTEVAQSDEEDYFVNNYQYNRNQLNDWNNDFNNWYSNPWYRNNYYGSAINHWHSPYYGYNSWNSPWYDPFWSYNGWSSTFSFHYGSRWNYGWGGQYDYWNRPYYGWDPYFGGLGYYGGSYWNNYRYPGTVVIVGEGVAGRNKTYSKRPTRSTAIVNQRNAVRMSPDYVNTTRTTTSGRTSTTNNRQQEYYNRYNRAQSNTTNRSSYENRETTQYNRSRSWDNNDNNTYTPSGRTSSSPSYSTPSRSTYSGGTGSGTNGRTRGRN